MKFVSNAFQKLACARYNDRKRGTSSEAHGCTSRWRRTAIRSKGDGSKEGRTEDVEQNTIRTEGDGNGGVLDSEILKEIDGKITKVGEVFYDATERLDGSGYLIGFLAVFLPLWAAAVYHELHVAEHALP